MSEPLCTCSDLLWIAIPLALALAAVVLGGGV